MTKYKTVMNLPYKLDIWESEYTVERNDKYVRISRPVRNYYDDNNWGMRIHRDRYTLARGNQIIDAAQCALRQYSAGGERRGYNPYEVLAGGLTSNYNAD